MNEIIEKSIDGLKEEGGNKRKEIWNKLVSTGINLREENDRSQVGLGLLALKVEKDYGKDKFGQFALEIGVDKGTLRNYRWVVFVFIQKVIRLTFSSSEEILLEKINEKKRNLSFSHLQKIVGTDNPEQWLEKTIKNNYSVSDLKIALNELKSESSSLDKKIETKRTIKAHLMKLLMDFFDDEKIKIDVVIIDKLAIVIDDFYRKNF